MLRTAAPMVEETRMSFDSSKSEEAGVCIAALQDNRASQKNCFSELIKNT